MSYKTILVHAGDDKLVESRLRLARDLGEAFQSTLLGVGAVAWDPATTPRAPAFQAAEALLDYERGIESRLGACRRVFEAHVDAYPHASAWRQESDFPRLAMARAANGADLIVASPTLEADGRAYDFADPGDLIMETGLPVLVAPPGAGALRPEVVAVGWKAARETRRAISAALPLLLAARKVVLIRIDEEPPAAQVAEATGDAADRLRRHGIEVEVLAAPGEAPTTADDLVRRASERSAGLLVIGAYGRSRLREWAFGGVTRDLLADPGLPVFLAR